MKKIVVFLFLVAISYLSYSQYGRVYYLYTDIGISQKIYNVASAEPYNCIYPYNLGFKVHSYGSKRLKFEFAINFRYINLYKTDFSYKHIWGFDYLPGLRWYPYNSTFRLGKHLFFKPTASASLGFQMNNFRYFDMLVQWSAGFCLSFNNNQRGFVFEVVHKPLSFPYTKKRNFEFYLEPSWSVRIGVRMAKY